LQPVTRLWWTQVSGPAFAWLEPCCRPEPALAAVLGHVAAQLIAVLVLAVQVEGVLGGPHDRVGLHEVVVGALYCSSTPCRIAGPSTRLLITRLLVDRG
jgi:hypothetical protein